MKRIIQLTIICLVVLAKATAQHTFSIVAVDPITGEVGSAGASCLDNNQFPGSGGAYIISDIIPGRGAIHTQAYYLSGNQDNARAKMLEGFTPAEIIDWLKTNDVQANSTRRQYGIADFDAQGLPRSAAHTGVWCDAWRGHKLGTNYSIQGNILLGAFILDSMEARFLAAQGTLADRLMACLQGANVPGADKRCLANGTSSLSAFLRVAKPDDNENNLYIDMNVPSLPSMTEPIDSLQTIYDHWKLTKTEDITQTIKVDLYPNPAQNEVTLLYSGTKGQVDFYDLTGKKVYSSFLIQGQNTFSPNLPKGAYILKIADQTRTMLIKKLFWQ